MCSSARSRSPCSKNSEKTRSTTRFCTSHGLLDELTSHAVISIDSSSRRPRSDSQTCACAASELDDVFEVVEVDVDVEPAGCSTSLKNSSRCLK